MIDAKLRNHQRYRILAEGPLSLYGLLLFRLPGCPKAIPWRSTPLTFFFFFFFF